jgi:hypothetical protein
MFAGEGLCGLIGSLVYMGMQASLLRRAGYQGVPDAYVIGWFAASAATFLIGCYFVVSGRWVLEMVFVSQQARESESSDE